MFFKKWTCKIKEKAVDARPRYFQKKNVFIFVSIHHSGERKNKNWEDYFHLKIVSNQYFIPIEEWIGALKKKLPEFSWRFRENQKFILVKL